MKIAAATPRKQDNLPAVIKESWRALQIPSDVQLRRFDVVGQGHEEAYTTAITQALEWQPDLVLIMDCDILPPADGLIKLLQSISEFDAVGGLYLERSDKPEWNREPLVWFQETPPRRMPPQDAVTECNGVGFGFTLIRADVFTKIPTDPWPWFFIEGRRYPGIPRKGGWSLGNGIDCNFFLRFPDAGLRVAIDSRVRCGHMALSTGHIIYPEY